MFGERSSMTYPWHTLSSLQCFLEVFTCIGYASPHTTNFVYHSICPSLHGGSRLSRTISTYKRCRGICCCRLETKGDGLKATNPCHLFNKVSALIERMPLRIHLRVIFYFFLKALFGNTNTFLMKILDIIDNVNIISMIRTSLLPTNRAWYLLESNCNIVILWTMLNLCGDSNIILTSSSSTVTKFSPFEVTDKGKSIPCK